MSQGYLSFHRVIPSTTVTSRWLVENHGTPLGEIKWFSHWRRYAFFPAPGTIFDAACLGQLADFCRTETLCRIAERT